MPDFQRKHYRHIADALRIARMRPNDSADEALSDLIEDLCERFACDSASFDPDTFRRACGDGLGGRDAR